MSTVHSMTFDRVKTLHPRNLSNNEILKAARCTPDGNFSLKRQGPERLPVSKISHPFTENAAVILFQTDSSKG